MIRMNYQMNSVFLLTNKPLLNIAFLNNVLRLLSLVTVSVFLLNTSVFAQQTVPDLTGRVVDQADILSLETVATLEALLEEHENRTSNQVAVLTVASLEGEAIEDFSLRVAREWGLGQADKNNGVLLTVAVEDRKMRIEVGYGLEGPLPDVVASRIIRNEITPPFRNGDFNRGVMRGIEAILGSIEGTYVAEESSGNGFDDMPWFGRLIFGCMFMFMPLIFAFFSVLFGPLLLRIFMFFFTLPFIAVGSFALFGKFAPIIVGLYILAYILGNIYLNRSPKWQDYREKYEEAKKKGDPVKIELFGIPMTISTQSSSGSSGGGWSSGGGGFSGGGGSFGGGGASGGW